MRWAASGAVGDDDPDGADGADGTPSASLSALLCCSLLSSVNCAETPAVRRVVYLGSDLRTEERDGSEKNTLLFDCQIFNFLSARILLDFFLKL